MCAGLVGGEDGEGGLGLGNGTSEESMGGTNEAVGVALGVG